MKMTLPNRLAPAAVAALLSLPATALAQSAHAAAPFAPPRGFLGRRCILSDR